MTGPSCARPSRDAARTHAARTAWALLAGLAAVALAGCSAGPIAQNTPLSGSGYVDSSYSIHFYPPGSRLAAPKISGTTLDGQHFSLAADRGSVVVLNFWGSWCPPCRREAPALAALARLFKSDQVHFTGVDIRDSVASAEAFEQTFNIGYPSLNDPAGLVALAFHGTVPPDSFPSTLVINRAGQIAGSVFGAASYAGLRALIAKVLAERT